jgi:hypothetical protein
MKLITQRLPGSYVLDCKDMAKQERAGAPCFRVWCERVSNRGLISEPKSHVAKVHASHPFGKLMAACAHPVLAYLACMALCNE